MYHAPYTAMMKVNPKDAIRDVALKNSFLNYMNE